MSPKVKLYCALGGGLLAESRLPNGVPCETNDYIHLPVNETGVITLKKIANKIGSENVFLIILAATPERKRRKTKWIKKNHIIERIGMPADNAFFVTSRLEKSRLCKKLGITVAIDDVIEPLVPLAANKSNRLFAFQPSDLKKYITPVEGILVVESWKEIWEIINF